MFLRKIRVLIQFTVRQTCAWLQSCIRAISRRFLESQIACTDNDTIKLAVKNRAFGGFGLHLTF